MAALALAVSSTVHAAQVAGRTGPDDLVIVHAGKTQAVIVVSPQPGELEKAAAEDLAKYIELMAGARPALANTPESIAAALKAKTPVFLLGSEALKANPALQQGLDAAAKKNPLLRADAIVVRRADNLIYLAGNSDPCHYFAVAELLKLWGCRWYMPTEFGECIPIYPELKIGAVDTAYGSPFEIRKIGIGESPGCAEFRRRNMTNEIVVPNTGNLGAYTQDIAPDRNIFRVAISAEATARHVARRISEQYGKGQDVSLGMNDGIYEPDSEQDKELMKLQWDKYFMLPSMTDAFMVLYNNVAEILMKEHPDSKAHIGFLAHANMTLPPVREIAAKGPLIAYLSPLDIDPIHGMDDPQSPPRGEYREMLYKWAKVMQGRLAIYDYDQGMLVWRDIPAPSVQAFRQDVKHYQKAGILGVDTESRLAVATVFNNLFFRAQLLWNPDYDVDALLEEFYTTFYGPAAVPMNAYWSAILKAWNDSIVTEHEYFAAPAIYMRDLLASLRTSLDQADALMQAAAAKQPSPNRNDRLYADRMRFTHLSFDLITSYMAMVKAAATDGDYAAAVAAGQKGLATREELSKMNASFTAYAAIPEVGPAWWPGEVQQYQDLLAYTNGAQGRLILRLPIEWAFRRDPKDVGLKDGYATKPVDLRYWKEKGKTYTPDTRKEYPVTEWEMIRSDLYAQAQGIRCPDRQGFTGYLWYRTELNLSGPDAAMPVRIRFPGLFNEAWLYVNGVEVGHRKQERLWWLNDYKFEWDVDIAGKLKGGTNVIALRLNNPDHMGGMFRRPFLYVPIEAVR